MCDQGCQDCQPLEDIVPENNGFKIKLKSCELISLTERKFIYQITPVGNPPNSISNVLICLCPEAFVNCAVTVTDQTANPICEFETNPNAQGNPVVCQGVKFEELGENKAAGSGICLSITVLDELITVKPISIGYKAATFNFVWEVCGPACEEQPDEERKRGIKL